MKSSDLEKSNIVWNFSLFLNAKIFNNRKKSLNVIHHINKLKEENQIISRDAESEFNKIK